MAAAGIGAENARYSSTVSACAQARYSAAASTASA